MTLADRIGRALEQHGARNHRQLARLVITEVREHDTRLLDQIRVRDLPMPDCPDGCVVGAEWRRQAEHARALMDAWAIALLSWGPGEPMPDALIAAEHALLAAATPREDDRD